MLRFLGFTNQPNLEHRNAEKIERWDDYNVKCVRLIITWSHAKFETTHVQKIQLPLLLSWDRSWWIIRSKSFDILYIALQAMCWLNVKFVSDIWRAWDSQLSFSSKMKVHLANCLRRTRRKYLNVTGLLKQEPNPALKKFYPHISFLLRLHFLIYAGQTNMMMSLTNMFTKEDMAADKGCIETGTILQSGNSNYFAILQPKKKEQ